MGSPEKEVSCRYIMTLDRIRQKYQNTPSWIRITTITMTCKFFSQNIDIARIREYFQTHKEIRIRRRGALTNGNAWTMRDSEFYNQVTIGYEDAYTVKAVKVFPNGSFQVAGCADICDCRRVATQLAHILSTIFERPMPAKDFKVVMINTNFAMNQTVNLMELFETLDQQKRLPGTMSASAPTKDRPKFTVSFNPDRYSAVKIKFEPRPGMKEVTASVFSTGKVIVTGAETLQEIVFAYDVLNSEILLDRSVPDTTQGVFMGATFGDWVPALAERGMSAWD
jgi:TATA-box binding protein (TBP) (component of TFIID and TFIIIB)